MDAKTEILTRMIEDMGGRDVSVSADGDTRTITFKIRRPYDDGAMRTYDEWRSILETAQGVVTVDDDGKRALADHLTRNGRDPEAPISLEEAEYFWSFCTIDLSPVARKEAC